MEMVYISGFRFVVLKKKVDQDCGCSGLVEDASSLAVACFDNAECRTGWNYNINQFKTGHSSNQDHIVYGHCKHTRAVVQLGLSGIRILCTAASCYISQLHDTPMTADNNEQND